MLTTIQTYSQSKYPDVRAGEVRRRAKTLLGIDTGEIRFAKFYSINYPLKD